MTTASTRTKRKKAATGLAGEEETQAPAFCLDGECWRRKAMGWIKTLLTQDAEAVPLAEKFLNPQERARLDEEVGRRVLDWSDWNEIDEDDDEDNPPEGSESRRGVICHGDRLGQVVKMFMNPGAEQEKDDAPDFDSEEARREREARQREEEKKRKEREAEIKRFKAEMAKLLPEESAYDAEKLLALALWHGLNACRHNSRKNIDDMDKAEIARLVWKDVRVHILDQAGATYSPMSGKERKAMCERLGLDWDAIQKAVKDGKGKKR